MDDGVGGEYFNHLAALPHWMLDKDADVLGFQNHPHILR
jgi:hypothetical protein